MGLKLLTVAATEPIDLAQAKLHCRVIHDDEDALFEQILIPTAREAAEHATGRALVEQQWELTLDAFPGAEIGIPKPPLIAVQSVKYLDDAGELQTVNVDTYTVHTSGIIGKIVKKCDASWPATMRQPEAIRIAFTAGYGDATNIPAGIKAWMLLAIGVLYENREALAQGQQVELPGGFWEHLLDPHIVQRIN